MSSFNRKKLKFLGISLATLTATTVTLVACGNESKNSGDNKVINWYIPTEISTLDISKNTDAYSNLAIGNFQAAIYLELIKRANQNPI